MVTKHLVGCVVLTRYNNCTYRINDIAHDKSTFIDHAGQPDSFIDYYKQAYGRVVQRYNNNSGCNKTVRCGLMQILIVGEFKVFMLAVCE